MDTKNSRACRRTWNVKCKILCSGELKSRATVSSPHHRAANRSRHQRGKLNNSEVVTAVVDDRGRATPRDSVAQTKRPTWEQAEGSPLPLGVTWIEEEQAFNFAIHSEHAESVTLLLYAPTDLVNPLLTYRFDYLRNK